MWPLIFSLVLVHASDAVSTAIDEAQALLRKKDRQGACQLLAKTLSETSLVNRGGRKELSDTLHQVARVFLTDKGQRAFESGQSLMFESPDLALAQFREALLTEDNNLAVLESLAKLHLLKSECDPAAAQIARARAIDPIASEPALLELRVAVCAKSTGTVAEKIKALPNLDKWEEAYVQFLQGEIALENHSPKKSFDLLTKVTESFLKFPEAHYVLSRAAAETGRDNEPSLRRYVNLCQAITPKDRRRYSLEPRLCAHLKEAEDELSKKSIEN